MLLTPSSQKIMVIGLLLLALLILAAVHGSAVSAYSLLPIGSMVAGEPSILITTDADVRSGPGSEYLILATAQPGEQFSLLGKSADSHWWRIDYGGQPAWLPSTRARASARVATVGIGGTPN